MRLLLASFLAISPFSLAHAQKQKFDPPKTKTPDAAMLRLIEEKLARLTKVVSTSRVPEEHRADLEIYVKAVEWITRHQEWFTADSGKQTLAVLDQGLARAESAKDGKTPWLKPNGRSVARGYRSRVDGSVQPYGVIYPAGYGDDPKKAWRLDVFLHGRDSSLTEVKHLFQHSGREAPKDQDYVQLNIYGRGNNAFRWAGETDVSEALADFISREELQGRVMMIDESRLVLKGFSMGGAGTWHIGLRHPFWFDVIQPGAGFTTTHGYIARLPDPLPAHQEACLKIYDAYRYAENAFNVPIVAYSGELDAQKKAADNIEAELKRLKFTDRMVHLIGPKLEHRFPPEWQKRADEEIRKRLNNPDRPIWPERVRFVTYTLKSADAGWIRLTGLGRHYERTVVDATWKDEKIDIKTENVTGFLILVPISQLPKSVKVDGKELAVPAQKQAICQFEKTRDGWSIKVYDSKTEVRHKTRDLQGPIDDAFTSPFLCVIGSGKPNNQAMHDAAVAQLERFRREWDKYMRGTLVVKKDTEVTDDDRKRKNLILFGDPGSNKLVAEAMGKLSIKWTADTLEFASTKYDASNHLPMLIQPSPFGSHRYVVLNSGHTFHEAHFKGTNALLYPRLGDYAIVKLTPSDKEPAAFEVITAGLFDECWQFPKK